MAGRGVHAVVDGAEVAVGGPALLRELGLDAPPWLTEPTSTWRDRGAIVLTVVRDGKPIGSSRSRMRCVRNPAERCGTCERKGSAS